MLAIRNQSSVDKERETFIVEPFRNGQLYFFPVGKEETIKNTLIYMSINSQLTNESYVVIRWQSDKVNKYTIYIYIYIINKGSSDAHACIYIC